MRPSEFTDNLTESSVVNRPTLSKKTPPRRRGAWIILFGLLAGMMIGVFGLVWLVHPAPEKMPKAHVAQKTVRPKVVAKKPSPPRPKPIPIKKIKAAKKMAPLFPKKPPTPPKKNPSLPWAAVKVNSVTTSVFAADRKAAAPVGTVYAIFDVDLTWTGPGKGVIRLYGKSCRLISRRPGRAWHGLGVRRQRTKDSDPQQPPAVRLKIPMSQSDSDWPMLPLLFRAPEQGGTFILAIAGCKNVSVRVPAARNAARSSPARWPGRWKFVRADSPNATSRHDADHVIRIQREDDKTFRVHSRELSLGGLVKWANPAPGYAAGVLKPSPLPAKRSADELPVVLRVVTESPSPEDDLMLVYVDRSGKKKVFLYRRLPELIRSSRRPTITDKKNNSKSNKKSIFEK